MKRKIAYAFIPVLFGAVLLAAEQASVLSLLPWSGSQLRCGGNRMTGLNRRFGSDASGGCYDQRRPVRGCITRDTGRRSACLTVWTTAQSIGNSRGL